jgi:radical SAM superfamily enzyme YgiQ (UPF0313 family)
LSTKVFIATPPFTQLNTPYPATAYLKGFLNTIAIPSYQADLGIEVILQLFSRKGLEQLFLTIASIKKDWSKNAKRIIALEAEYINTIDNTMDYLQNNNPTLAHYICNGNYLPEASRFEQIADLEWAFGAMGIQDKARHLCTLYLEDLADLIVETVDPYFGFSRYAERLGRSALSFDTLEAALSKALTYIDTIVIQCLEKHIHAFEPNLVAISVPFPGNLFSAFRCAQWLKQHHPEIKVCLGGGYANTELRNISDPRVFQYFDFITLDDGELPLQHLIEYLENKRPLALLKRTFTLQEGRVIFCNGSLQKDYKQQDVGTPDYSDLLLQNYLSVIEVANPMHRLWSDGRWNKLTLAHGCYWGKCTFCDISLDYIKIYESTTASILADRIETIIQQTGQTGFHFVDEAAPPAMMRELALEIIRRKINITWWTNIRFEKSFSRDLCQLLAASGCIAVSGGLEVASDRLLKLIDKGVTVAQVAQVAQHLTAAGIMVHAYLMYGFPTQTPQETIDALEIVRQLFNTGIVQSGFWHQFAMTTHSPVGINPEQFKVQRVTQTGSFANNDLEHYDPVQNHDRYSDGLRKSLFNYMHGICFDYPLQEWFDFKIPRTTLAPNYISNILDNDAIPEPKDNHKLIWMGTAVNYKEKQKKLKKTIFKEGLLIVHTKKEMMQIPVESSYGAWLAHMLNNSTFNQLPTYQQWQKAYETENIPVSFSTLWNSDTVYELRNIGLLVL